MSSCLLLHPEQRQPAITIATVATTAAAAAITVCSTNHFFWYQSLALIFFAVVEDFSSLLQIFSLLRWLLVFFHCKYLCWNPAVILHLISLHTDCCQSFLVYVDLSMLCLHLVNALCSISVAEWRISTVDYDTTFWLWTTKFVIMLLRYFLIMKCSKQIHVLFTNTLYKNIKNTGEIVWKKCTV